MSGEEYMQHACAKLAHGVMDLYGEHCDKHESDERHGLFDDDWA